MPSSELIDDRAARLGRWFGAAIIIAGLHLSGGFLALMQWAEEEFDPDPAGAVVMELATLAVAPPDLPDLAVGPPVEDAMPTPIPTEESMLEELELPAVEESPLAPAPELVLPKIEPVETLKEVDEPELLQQQQQVTEINMASAVATAPPKVESVPVSTVVKAQTVGAKAKPNQAEITWHRALLLHLNRHKRYPAEARGRRVQGVAKVEFKIDAAGKLLQARVVKGSGSKLLDDEALAMLRRASPFPAPPNPPASGGHHLALPIEFKIR